MGARYARADPLDGFGTANDGRWLRGLWIISKRAIEDCSVFRPVGIFGDTDRTDTRSSIRSNPRINPMYILWNESVKISSINAVRMYTVNGCL